MQFDSSNRYFTLAADLVNFTSKNIFLTGKAGTGKTTFLKYIKQNCAKQLAVVAPTGVAAINAGGTTIHSFFQLPFSPFLPSNSHGGSGVETNNSHSLLAKIKVNTEKREIFQALELLIIDEISMVRCDILDAIDIVLRSFRSRYNEPFGGVQVLLIGDMHQLPPVTGDTEWNILSQFYKTPYFFSSQVIQQSSPLYISFEKIYRQSDEQFINLLNGVRNNDLDEVGMDMLNNLYNPDFQPTKDDGYIILTTHNNKADRINEEELSKIKSPALSYKATVEGEFYERSYPADEMLSLKIGAQVMFIKNDSEKIRRYYNGKIGTVTKVEESTIFVQCKDDDKVIEVKKEKWENIRYSMDKQTQQIEEDIIGSFTQYPLRLAWAITIHKSQGLTFEKAVIDAGAAFAPGQVYVALSRCTNIKGLVLHSHINYGSLKLDERIHHFSRNIASEAEIELQLTDAKHKHQQGLLLSLCNFSLIIKSSEHIVKHLEENSTSFNESAKEWIQNIDDKLKALQETGNKFQLQLTQLMQAETLPQENANLQARIIAAAKYFDEQLRQLIDLIRQSPISTDNRELAKKYNQQLGDLFTQISEKHFLFTTCLNGFDATTWYSKKRDYRVPDLKVNAYGGAVTYKSNNPHPSLYMKLKQLRDEICERTGKPVYLVASSKTLDEICQYLPQNLHELGQIGGFGKVKLKEMGNKFLSIITEYTEQHNLSSLISGKEPKKEKKEKKDPKPETRAESFRLYKERKTVAEIAALRNLAAITIEGHLAAYVKTGEIQIQEFLSEEKLNKILPVIESYEGSVLQPLKEQLGNDISYGDIKFAMAWREYQKGVSVPNNS